MPETLTRSMEECRSKKWRQVANLPVGTRLVVGIGGRDTECVVAQAPDNPVSRFIVPLTGPLAGVGTYPAYLIENDTQWSYR
jgi:hypothetical protein